MKRFQFTSLIGNTVYERDEDNMPDWLTRKENKWFLEGHVLTLEIGKCIESDFWRIKRILAV